MPELRALLLPQNWYQDMADLNPDLNEAPTDCNPWAPDPPEFDLADYVTLDGATLSVFGWGMDRRVKKVGLPPVVTMKRSASPLSESQE